MAEKIKFIEDTRKTTIPGIGFDYWFVSDEFNRLYKKEQKISALSKVVAGLAMCITILGLYGLASYMAEQKAKDRLALKPPGPAVKYRLPKRTIRIEVAVPVYRLPDYSVLKLSVGFAKAVLMD